MFCQHCGSPLPEGSVFCSRCGNPTGAAPAAPSVPRILPGFSARISDPAILAALKKNRRGTVIFAVILVLAPLLVTLILGLKDDDLSILGVGAVVSAVFLLSSLIFLLKKKGTKQWDGIVTDKRTEIRKTRHSSEDGRAVQTETVYITQFRTANGKTKKLEESEINCIWYDYLNVGDYVRYHPQFNCYYEKYDKSRDSYVICPLCNTRNSITGDTCTRCGAPVIK